MIRKCEKCKTPINECMGFVKASDFVEAVKGLRPWTHNGHSNIRELCGMCNIVWIWCGDILLSREIAEALG